MAIEPACATSSSTASTSSTGSTRSHAEGLPVPSVLLRITPGRARPHPRVHRHRPGRLQVRLQPRQRRRADGRSSGPGARASVELVGLHCHIGSNVFVARRFAKAAEVHGRRSPCRSTCPSCRSAAASAWPTSRARRRRRSPSGATSLLDACDAPGVAAARQRRARPGDRGRGGRSPLYTVGTIKDIPGMRTYVAVDGGMSDNPRPVLYGSGYEAFLPREVAADRPLPVARRRQALRVGRRAGARGARARRPRRRRHARHAGHRRLRPLDGLELQQGAPRRRWCSWPTATPGWSCAGRRSTTCSPRRRLSG